jgi:hypothetical protein
MSEMELLARLRADLPAGPVPASAASALQAAIGGEKDLAASRPAGRDRARSTGHGSRRMTSGRWARTWRPLAAGGLTMAVAAGVAVAQFLLPARTFPSPGQVAGGAAAAAVARPGVRPGQWVYWKNVTVGCTPGGVERTWTTADAGNTAYLYHHRFRFTGSSGGSTGSVGSTTIMAQAVPICHHQPVLITQSAGVVQPARAGGTLTISGPSPDQVTAAETGQPQFSYASLDSLPRDPQALAGYLGRLRLPVTDLGRGDDQAFFLTYALLSTYVLPPRLTAELYQALGDLPGLTVDRHAADVAGRTGIGLRLPLRRGSGLTQELVFSPRSYRLLGYQVLRQHHVVSGTAFLRRALVPRP